MCYILCVQVHAHVTCDEPLVWVEFNKRACGCSAVYDVRTLFKIHQVLDLSFRAQFLVCICLGEFTSSLGQSTARSPCSSSNHYLTHCQPKGILKESVKELARALLTNNEYVHFADTSNCTAMPRFFLIEHTQELSY